MMDTGLGKKAERVLHLLAEAYHSPRHNNKSDPVDEVIFIILSQMTTRRSYEQVYELVARRYAHFAFLCGSSSFNQISKESTAVARLLRQPLKGS